MVFNALMSIKFEYLD